LGIDTVARRIESVIVPQLERLPIISAYAKTRGWPFVIAWLHRISGILLVIYTLFHIYTLSDLHTPEAYQSKMQFLRFFVFLLLEWALAVPVIFHALNGGRLLLYEIFGARNDASFIRWTWSLTTSYTLLLGIMMVVGNQTVTPGFFWLTTLIIACSLSYVVAVKIRRTAISLAWKYQRITGSFLLIMIPAHMLFMHLNAATGHEASVVIARMQNIFIKIVDLGLLFGVLFHGGYGVLSIAKDYISSESLHSICAVVVLGVMILFAFVGVNLTIRV
jgi:succinate dehydrogenase hydrophobic anchor subunit